MYMIRDTWRAQRGKAPAIIEAVKMVNQAITAQAGFSNGKIYADMSGPLIPSSGNLRRRVSTGSTKWNAGVFVNPDAATQRLIDTLNGSTVEGQREIYEVIV